MQVKVHAASLNCNLQLPESRNVRGSSCSALIFDEKMRSESILYAMQTTVVAPQVILLVANRLDITLEPEQDPE